MSDMTKKISFFGLIALGAAGVIGSSWIYTNSKFFAKFGAGGEVFGLAIATCIAITIALAYAELATIFPRAGGEVVYTYVAYGKKVSFIAGWALIGAYLSSLAFYVSATGLLVEKFFPQIAVGPFYTIAGTPVYLTELALGIAVTLAVFLFNYYGANLASGIQQILFSGMILIAIVLVVVGFTHGDVSNFWPAFTPDMNPTTSIMRFILPALTFLTGFELVAVLAEEADMTPKKIGQCVVLSIVLAGGFYTTVMLASAWIIPWEQTAGFKMGTIDAFTQAGFPVLGICAYIISALGLMTSFLGLFSATPRLILALARANMLPAMFTEMHPKYGTPAKALWLTLGLTLAFGWLGKGALVWFLDMGGFTIAVAWVMTVFSLFKIRSKYPDLHGAFRIKHLIFPLIGGVAATAVALATLIPHSPLSLEWPAEYIMLIAWCLAGFALYSLAPKVNEEENLKALLGKFYNLVKPNSKPTN